MKLLSVFFIVLFLISCDKDNNGVIDGTEEFFCWDCTFKTKGTVNGQTVNDSFNAEVCNKNVVQIRQYEKDNSMTTNHGGGVTTTVKVTCLKK